MSDLESRILEIGAPLVAAAQRGGGGFGQGGFTGKLVESVMADPAFKVEAFRFVDELGWLNQALASRCNRVTMSVAGLELTLK